MPDLPRTQRHLEEGLSSNQWCGYSLTAIRRGNPHTLFGGKVTAPHASVCWLSSGKPVVAAGVLRVLEEKPDLWDHPLSKTFPELTGTPLGNLKLRSVLTHQTGLRFPNLDLSAPRNITLQTLAQTSSADCQLTPEQAAYDPRGGWWLLQQWIEHHSNRPWRDYLHKTILEPSGAREIFFAEKNRNAEIPMEERKSDQWVAAPIRNEFGNLCGSSLDLARFYQTVGSGGVSLETGKKVLQPASIRKFLQPWRTGVKDMTFLHTVDFGLGIILDSNKHGATTVPYGFGTKSSDKAFGHGGARSSIGFADPEHDLVVTLCLIGQVPEPRHQARMRTLIDLLRSELA
jgi:CubicO group peptidase (beta-lactamase class C family)